MGSSSSSTRRAHPSRWIRRSEEHTSELQSRQDLHSFPTRRSSDLAERVPGGLAALRGLRRVAPGLRSGPARGELPQRLPLSGDGVQRLHRRGHHGWGVRARQRAGHTLHAGFEDRKSTRLNSSHAKIYTLSLHDALPISQNACLVASPRFVDYGVSRPDCAPAPREVNYLNACRSPVTVSNVFIGAGTTDGEFELVNAPGTPFTLDSKIGRAHV